MKFLNTIYCGYKNFCTRTVSTAIVHAGIDMLVGIGGAPEAVVSAVALKCLGGEIQGRLLPNNEQEYNRCLQMGITDPAKPIRMEQFVRSNDCIFVATGITEGLLLHGVRSIGKEIAVTHSLLAYGCIPKIHFIESVHQKALVNK
ncbi:fructose-bisphosphatase class II [Paenibacillus filicis]|uniref:fructose-bisphosphatase n=1 Tax=Paenibacillus gyeongsangnamensis TaxID=3388067 RepID=A0ABT4Q4E2_9BACL|nr:fructose-bisphosphatase class II [Paenibacillus filicis]MCZ8511748.1 fructose-bisphosphatase class II [Paenibacillus filicis]